MSSVYYHVGFFGIYWTVTVSYYSYWYPPSPVPFHQLQLCSFVGGVFKLMLVDINTGPEVLDTVITSSATIPRITIPTCTYPSAKRMGGLMVAVFTSTNTFPTSQGGADAIMFGGITYLRDLKSNSRYNDCNAEYDWFV